MLTRIGSDPMAQTPWLPRPAQSLHQLLGGIGIGRQPELDLRGLDARARRRAELAVSLACGEAAPCQQLLQLLHLLERPFGHLGIAAAERWGAVEARRQMRGRD